MTPRRVPEANGSTTAARREQAAATPRVMHRPGGRSERIRHAVSDAVREYFREGEINFSVRDVADRAGVHRTTVYRRWPTRADLVAEALRDHTAQLKVPDTGSWRTDLEKLVFELADFFADPVEVGMNVSLAAGNDPQSSAVTRHHWGPVIDSIRQPILRAVERGEIDPDLDADALLELMMSPLVLQTVLLHRKPRKAALKPMIDVLYRVSIPNTKPQ
jgi:AcrR family transcriptional regulator